MIKISTNFDSKRFMQAIETKAKTAVETRVREKLRGLPGIKVTVGSSQGGKMDIKLSGPEHSIEEAKKRLG